MDLTPDTTVVEKSPSLFGRTGKAISYLFKGSAENTAATAGAATATATTTTPTPPTPAPIEPRVGDIVGTLFGPAKITGIRGGGGGGSGGGGDGWHFACLFDARLEL